MSISAVLIWWLLYVGVGLASVGFLLGRGARSRWFMLGITSYVLAAGLKALLVQAIDFPADHSMPAAEQAILTGLVSAVVELTVAALFLVRAKPTLPDVLAF